MMAVGTLLLILGILAGGLWVMRDYQAAAIEGVLAFFDEEYYWRQNCCRVDKYYEELTKDRMRSTLRGDLLRYGHLQRDKLVSELHIMFLRRKHLYRLFIEYSVAGRAGKQVWTEQQFAFFVDKCLGHGSDTAAILWRCFWYNATYPFTELTDEDREQGQELDLDAWKQAITLLASDVGTGVGYGRPRYTIFGREQDIKLSRFMAMAVPRDGASPKNSPTVNDSAADKIDDDENDWHLPTELEKIAFVAATQLPIDMKFAGPHLSEVLPRVRKLVVNDGRGGSNNDGNRNVQFSADDFVIPYQDMVNLLAAVLQINEACPNTLTRSICDHELLRMPKKVGRKANRAVAEAILAAGGIRSWSAITFSMYSVFVDKLSSYEPGSSVATWSIEKQLNLLWRSIFTDSVSKTNPGSPSPPAMSSLILLTLDSILPYQNSLFDRLERRAGTLAYTASYGARAGPSHQDILASLTWPYSPKWIMVYGHVTVGGEDDDSNAATSRQPAMLAVVLPSPLWCTYKTGKVDDFTVTDNHYLLEIAPQPRVLRYGGALEGWRKTTFADIVATSSARSVISFGESGAIAGASSGLTLDFRAGVATLSSVSGGRGYVEIPPRPSGKPPTTQAVSLEACTTSVQIQKIEVYTGSGGVEVGLDVPGGRHETKHKALGKIGGR